MHLHFQLILHYIIALTPLFFYKTSINEGNFFDPRIWERGLNYWIESIEKIEQSENGRFCVYVIYFLNNLISKNKHPFYKQGI